VVHLGEQRHERAEGPLARELDVRMVGLTGELDEAGELDRRYDVAYTVDEAGVPIAKALGREREGIWPG
jgi:hypothetical protein